MSLHGSTGAAMQHFNPKFQCQLSPRHTAAVPLRMRLKRDTKIDSPVIDSQSQPRITLRVILMPEWTEACGEAAAPPSVYRASPAGVHATPVLSGDARCQAYIISIQNSYQTYRAWLRQPGIEHGPL